MSLSMGVMSLVTLLLSLQLGVAQTSALQNSERRCRMQSCANSLLHSLALDNKFLCQSNPASLPKHTCINRGLKHSRQHIHQPCRNHRGKGAENNKKPGLRRWSHNHQTSISSSSRLCTQPFAQQYQLMGICSLKAG